MANYTNVIASNICDAAGNKLTAGVVSFQATDAANQPLSFQVGGGGQVVTTPAAAAIAGGTIAGGFQVADSASTSPTGVLYRITVTDTTLNRVVVAYSLVTVTGATFNLDTYVPTGASVLPPVGGSVNGPLTVVGDLNVTGNFNPGTLGNVTATGNLIVDGDAIFKKTPFIDVRAYGAVGDGITDNLAFVNAACAAASGAIVYFPPGNYVLSATPTSAVGAAMKFQGAGKDASKITLASGTYFVDDNQSWSSFQMRGLRFENGAGAIRNRFTGTSVSSMVEIDDCYFDNYTGAAVSDNSSDHPYLKIRHCTFKAANTTAAIGVAFAGDASRSEISENAFLNNAVHIKLSSPKPVTITGNDFIQFSSGSSRASVWLVPTHDAFTFTSQGTQILVNKFGSENIATSDFRILIADEGAGAFVGDRLPVTTASTGHVGGIQIIGNFVSGANSTGNPFVYSYCPNVTGMYIGPTQMAGTPISTLLQFDAVATPTSVGRSNVIGPVLLDPTLKTTNLTATVFPQATNASWTASVIDPDGWLAAHDNSLPTAYAAGTSAAGFTNFSPGTITGWITGGSTTSSNIADVDAGTDAVELTMPLNGTWRQATTGGNLAAGVPTYVEFDLKVGSTSPLGTIYVNLQQSGVIYWGQDFTIPSSGWRRCRGEFVLPTATTLIAFIQNVNASGTVDVGRFKIYQAYEPASGGKFITPVSVGGGSSLARYARYSLTLSPAAVAANTTAEQSFATSVTSGDVIIGVSKPTTQAGLGIVGHRSSGTTLFITFSNNTAAPITPTASEVYQVVAVQ